MSNDPRDTLDASSMSRIQIAAIAVTVGLNALDGFDVLSISFASPGIAKEWGVDRATLGLVLSMELIGMGFGSVLLGGLADRVGRRRTLFGCLAVMVLGMFMVTRSRGVIDLSVWRVFTGFGIGGILATINAVAAEFSNARRRSLNVSIMAIGYPLGAVVGGSICAALLKHGDWRPVFLFGAAATALFIPLVYRFVPESISWLCQKQPAGALAGVNRSLARMGHAPVAALPAVSAAGRQRSAAGIFAPQFMRATTLLTLAYFTHVLTFYFLLKWVPKIVVDMGFSPSAAAGVLVWANVGGASGGVALGLLSLRFGLKPLTVCVLLMSAVMVTIFGRGQTTLAQLALVCAMFGFFSNGGIVGLYGLLARAFPTDLRATGTGFAVGFGRAGAWLAPVAAGLLFRAGYGLPFVAIAMGMGSLIAAGVLCFLPLRSGVPDANEAAAAPGSGR